MIYVTHDQIEAMTLADKIAVMRDGRIEQVGSPMELYNNPANRFVANFLGLTAMNFLHRSVPDLPAGQTIGIRPEHLRLDDTGVISGKVTHVERLGGDTNLLVTTEQGETLTVRLFGQDPTAVGDFVHLAFDPENAFYFDEAQERIFADAA